jgi:hypothetical protein
VTAELTAAGYIHANKSSKHSLAVVGIAGLRSGAEATCELGQK